MISITLLAIITAAIATLIHSFARLNHRQMARQKCLAAAAAQLDSYTINDKPLDKKTIQHLWPKLTVDTAITTGTDQWQNLTLITVTTKAETQYGPVTLKLTRYIPKLEERDQ